MVASWGICRRGRAEADGIAAAEEAGRIAGAAAAAAAAGAGRAAGHPEAGGPARGEIVGGGEGTQSYFPLIFDVLIYFNSKHIFLFYLVPFSFDRIFFLPSSILVVHPIALVSNQGRQEIGSHYPDPRLKKPQTRWKKGRPLFGMFVLARRAWPLVPRQFCGIWFFFRVVLRTVARSVVGLSKFSTTRKGEGAYFILKLGPFSGLFPGPVPKGRHSSSADGRRPSSTPMICPVVPLHSRKFCIFSFHANDKCRVKYHQIPLKRQTNSA